MKKVLIWAMALTMLISLASCGGNDTDTTAAGTDAATEAPVVTNDAADNTAEAGDDTTAPADETVAETEADDALEGGTVLATWKFDSDEIFETWTVEVDVEAPSITNSVIEDGALKLELSDTNIDPKIQLNFIAEEIEVENVKYIEMKVKNNTPETAGNFYYCAGGMSEAAFSADAWFPFKTQTSGEEGVWEIVKVAPPADQPDFWYDYLVSLRMDPIGGCGGTYYIEYITIYGE